MINEKKRKEGKYCRGWKDGFKIKVEGEKVGEEEKGKEM